FRGQLDGRVDDAAAPRRLARCEGRRGHLVQDGQCRTPREPVPVSGDDPPVRSPAMAGPLEGVRVVELGVWVAGPAAGGILADWGADVVKIEPLTGDPGRQFGRMLSADLPFNPPFELDNRGKRSVAVDLGTDEGAGIVRRLLD